jgi:autophagy-related protein 2
MKITAETAYDMVSPAGPSVRRRLNRKGKRKRIHPPQVSLTLQIELIFDD